MPSAPDRVREPQANDGGTELPGTCPRTARSGCTRFDTTCWALGRRAAVRLRPADGQPGARVAQEEGLQRPNKTHVRWRLAPRRDRGLQLRGDAPALRRLRGRSDGPAVGAPIRGRALPHQGGAFLVRCGYRRGQAHQGDAGFQGRLWIPAGRRLRARVLRARHDGRLGGHFGPGAPSRGHRCGAWPAGFRALVASVGRRHIVGSAYCRKSTNAKAEPDTGAIRAPAPTAASLALAAESPASLSS